METVSVTSLLLHPISLKIDGHQCVDRNDSDDLRGIPSLYSSVFLKDRVEEMVGRRNEEEFESRAEHT